MASNLIAAGITPRLSAPFDVTAAAPVTLVGRIGPMPGREWFADVLFVNADASYTKAGRITQDQPTVILSAPGTYRVSADTGVNCIIDRN